MKKYELPHVRKRLSGLTGQCLHDVGYAADMLTLGFGLEGEYRLHIECSYRMATEAAILFDRIDYFIGEEPDNRLFNAVRKLQEQLDGMTVASVDVNQLGDLSIRFANGVMLLALPMRSDDDECWRFWNDELWLDQHMVVYGDHVELHGPGDGCCGICE